MDIFVIFDIDSKRMTSAEDKSVLAETQTEFSTAYSTNADMFLTKDVVCTKTVFDEIVNKAGTRQAPVLIESATAQKVSGRLNVYVENGSLKIVA